jgi:type IV pilus assembly protein PilX
MRNIPNRSKQKGMAMFISLIMLLLMSIIILHGARSSTLEVLLGNNSQNTAQSLMRAEDSVIAGEQVIELNYSGAPAVDFSANKKDGLYLLGEIDVNAIDWSDYPAERVGSGDNYREYVIEYLGPSTATGGSLAIGAGVASDKRYLYRVSGRGESSRGGARVVQTIYATTE